MEPPISSRNSRIKTLLMATPESRFGSLHPPVCPSARLSVGPSAERRTGSESVPGAVYAFCFYADCLICCILRKSRKMLCCLLNELFTFFVRHSPLAASLLPKSFVWRMYCRCCLSGAARRHPLFDSISNGICRCCCLKIAAKVAALLRLIAFFLSVFLSFIIIRCCCCCCIFSHF